MHVMIRIELFFCLILDDFSVSLVLIDFEAQIQIVCEITTNMCY